MTYREYLLKFGFARPAGKAPAKPEEAAGEFVGETDKLEETEETEEIGDAGETETEDPGGLENSPPPETPHKEPKPPKKGKAPAKK